MIVVTAIVVFSHDRKQEELEERLDFAFSGESLARALGYYRFMAVWMLFCYVAFTTSCVWLQADGYPLFAERNVTLNASPIAISLFCLDLVLRGGFFDFMQHFDLSLTHLQMNRNLRLFVWYAFVFRMVYGLILVKILFSFVWIYGKVRLNREARRRAALEEAAQPRLFE